MDMVLRARGNMQTDKANGLEDITVTEMLNELLRCHFSSRAISVQVNIVAVSIYMFHRFHFDLLSQVSTTSFLP